MRSAEVVLFNLYMLWSVNGFSVCYTWINVILIDLAVLKPGNYKIAFEICKYQQTLQAAHMSRDHS